MIPALRDLLHDPDRTALHRSLRVALVMPPLFALGLVVVGDPQFALLAAFGSFSAKAMADFTGPARSRLASYIVLGLLGAALVAIGTALSNTLWPAVLAMLAIGTLLQFAAGLGGQFALGNNAAILAFVVTVMVPVGIDALPARLAGWLLACACAAVATALLWPRHERRDLYRQLAAAFRALAASARSAAAGDSPAASLGDVKAAIDRVRETQRVLGFRPIGPPGRQQALLGLVDGLGLAWRFAGAMAAQPPASGEDRRLAAAVATTLDGVADVLSGCADDHPGVGPDLAALIATRHEHRRLLEAATRAAVAEDVPAPAVVAAVHAIFPVRVLSFVALSMATDAVVLTGRSVRVDSDDFGVVEATEAEGALRYAARVLMPHLSLRAVWLRNSLRAGVALALSVAIAKVSGIEHAFWVVLATLTVLRSNVVTTGSTALTAVTGTVAGFVIATVAHLAIGGHPTLMWVTLPLAVFLAAYAPMAVSLGAGQAMFAVLVVELFNLMAPAGWETGAIRLEAVTVGALAALGVSLLMWPKGASAALRVEVAQHVRAAKRLTQAAFDALLGKGGDAGIAAARDDCIAARRRAEEALAAYSGERGAKRVPLPVWALMVQIPVAMRVADDALSVIRHAGFGNDGASAAARRLAQSAAAIGAAFDEMACRLDGSLRAADAALAARVADLDMIGGTGIERAALVAATAADLEARRGDADAVPQMMGLCWANGWLGYLAFLRRLAEEPLDQVEASGNAPWWR